MAQTYGIVDAQTHDALVLVHFAGLMESGAGSRREESIFLRIPVFLCAFLRDENEEQDTLADQVLREQILRNQATDNQTLVRAVPAM